MAEAVQPDAPDATPLSKDELERYTDRVYVPCFQKGQRVKVSQNYWPSSRAGMSGTVVSSSRNAAYVELDDFVAAGDPDPFRFDAEELVWIPESADMDSPEPYIAGLDFITPLVSLGYTQLRFGMESRWRKYTLNTGWRHSPHQGAANVRIEVVPLLGNTLVAAIYVEYSSAGEMETIKRIEVPYIEIVDTVREVEALIADPDVTCLSDFAKKLHDKHYPGDTPRDIDHLYYTFGESCPQEAASADDPQVYIDRLKLQASVVDAFRAKHAKLWRRPSVNNPCYKLGWMPNVELSYDLKLTPQKDDSWTVTATVIKSFSYGDGTDSFTEEFPVEQEWTIPANLSDDELGSTVDTILQQLSKHKGPAEPTLWQYEHAETEDQEEHPDDADIDPKAYADKVLAADIILTNLGYSYYKDSEHPHWFKKIPGTPITLIAGIRDDQTWVFQKWKDLVHKEQSGQCLVNLSGFPIEQMERYLKMEENTAKNEYHIQESAAEDDAVDPKQYLDRVLNSEAILKEMGYVRKNEETDTCWETWCKKFKTKNHRFIIQVSISGLSCSIVTCSVVSGKNWYKLSAAAQDEWLAKFRSQFSDAENAVIGPAEVMQGAMRMYVLSGKSTESTEECLPEFTHEVDTQKLKSALQTIEAGLQGYQRPVTESEDDDVDPLKYVASTFSPSKMLEDYGWTRIENKAGTDRAVFTKSFSTPTYALGGINVDRIEFTVDTDLIGNTDEFIIAKFLNAEGFGLPIKSWRLWRQQTPEGEPDYAENKNCTSSLRRFVSGLGRVMSSVIWPSANAGAVRAGCILESALNIFIKDLNATASKSGLDESEDPDSPDQYIRQLGTVDHVMKLNGFTESVVADHTGEKYWTKTLNLPRALNLGPAGGTAETVAVKVNYKVKPYRNPEQKRHQIYFTVYLATRYWPIIWSAENVFPSEGTAARIINMLVGHLQELLQDGEVTSSGKLRTRLSYGPGAEFKQYYDEALEDDVQDVEVKSRIAALPEAFYEYLKVPSAKVAEMTAVINDPFASAFMADLRAFEEGVQFKNGKSMDIIVRYGKFNEEDEDDSYAGFSEGVLFDASGSEDTETEPIYSFLGKYTVEFDGHTYTVEVVEDSTLSSATVEADEPTVGQ